MSNIAADILSGKYDSEIDIIRDAITARRNVVSRSTFLDLKVGDKVRFNDSVSPAYLIGVTGIIGAKRQKKVTFLADEGQYTGRFRGGIVCAPGLLEKY